MALATGFY